MKHFAVLVAALCVAGSGSTSVAQEQRILSTGNGYFSQCENDPSGFIGGLCLGYVMGLTNIVTPSLTGKPIDIIEGRGLAYCVPSNVTNGQYMDVVLDFLRRNPRHRHQYTVAIFVAAMNEAFPCADGTKVELRPELGYKLIPGQSPGP